MPFIVTHIFRKPNPSILWHSQYFTNKTSPDYRQTQLDYNLYENRSHTELDPLSLEVVVSWETEEKFNEYSNLPEVKFQQELFDLYNNSNNITKETTTRNV